MQQQIVVDRFLRHELSRSYNLNPYERILLVILASYMGVKDECFPSHHSLSLNCGMSTDSVRRYLKSLELKQLIQIKRANGSNNIYTLTIPFELPPANSTYRLQQPPADSGNHSPQIADTPPADSKINNINNNISKFTSLVNSKKKRTKLTSNKTALPSDLQINDSHKERAIQLGLDVDSEFEHFKEYYLAKGGKFDDWSVAFLRWLRNAEKFQSNKSTQKASIMEGVHYEKF